MAVGSSGDTEPDPMYESLVETWNGTAWSVRPTPEIGDLDSVYCISSSDCTVAGLNELESWNGATWKVSTQPDGSNGYLFGVTCTSASNCVAVGEQIDSSSSDFQTLVLSWHGGKWVVVPSPNRGTDTGQQALASVSCTGSKKCVAVGTGDGSLVETWDGNSWQIAPSGNLGDVGSNFLNDTSCPSATSCEAVGTYGGGQQTLIESGAD